MCNSQEFFDKILEGWERAESDNGVPYYVNHNFERTQWDHPVFVKLMEELSDMNAIRYAAYRTALKLRYVQKKFLLDLVDIRTINVVFARYGYHSEGNDVIDCSSLQTILVEIYNTNRVQNHSIHITNLETTAEIMLNWLLNMFDRKRTGYLHIHSVKIALGSLCSAKVSEKYDYFFSQVCDSTHHLSRKKMNLFLRDIMQIPELIGEGAPFGGLNTAPAVESCFAAAWKPESITEDEFLKWLLKEPQSIVWLPTLHRLAAAESVKHEAKCSICKAFPIIGFRYKCLKCFNYDLCQACFFNGRISNKHKLKHPIQEYCFATTVKQNTKDFIRTVRNNLSKKHRNKKKLRYLPIRGVNQPYKIEDDDDEPASEDEGDKYDMPDISPDQEEDDHLGPVIHNDLQNPHLTRHRPGPFPNYTNVLKELQEENRILRQQLKQLAQSALPSQPTIAYPLEPVAISNQQSYDSNSCSGSETSELEWLREERERMEAKQEVLEAHNKQLELQLYRLRLLLKEDGDGQTHTPSLRNEGEHSPQPVSFGSSISPNAPPPYQATPTCRPHQPTGQSMAISHNSGEPLSNRIDETNHEENKTPSVSLIKASPNPSPGNNNTTLDNLTLDQTDAVLQHTHYSLPSPSQSCYFPEEEAELQELMDKLDQAFPTDMTHSLIHNSRSAFEDVYEAANKIGVAISRYVDYIPDKAFDKPDGEEGNTTEELGVMYETGDMTAGTSQDILQYSSSGSAATPCAS